MIIFYTFYFSTINRGDLRRCSIHLLQSLLALPLHFANMPIKVSCDWWRAGHVTLDTHL